VQPYSIGAYHKTLEDTVAAAGLDWTFWAAGHAASFS
jgi:hypothetical protein